MENIVFSTDVNQYAIYEKSEHSHYERRCIDGSIVGCSKCCGYCQYEGHPGFLTEKQMKDHDCVKKQCYHFLKKPVREPRYKETNSSEFEGFVKGKLSCFDGIKVLRFKKTDNVCVAYFVTITNEYNFENCVFEAKNKYDVSLSFVRLNYDFDVCTKLIYAI